MGTRGATKCRATNSVVCLNPGLSRLGMRCLEPGVQIPGEAQDDFAAEILVLQKANEVTGKGIDSQMSAADSAGHAHDGIRVIAQGQGPRDRRRVGVGRDGEARDGRDYGAMSLDAGTQCKETVIGGELPCGAQEPLVFLL